MKELVDYINKENILNPLIDKKTLIQNKIDEVDMYIKEPEYKIFNKKTFKLFLISIFTSSVYTLFQSLIIKGTNLLISFFIIYFISCIAIMINGKIAKKDYEKKVASKTPKQRKEDLVLLKIQMKEINLLIKGKQKEFRITEKSLTKPDFMYKCLIKKNSLTKPEMELIELNLDLYKKKKKLSDAEFLAEFCKITKNYD